MLLGFVTPRLLLAANTVIHVISSMPPHPPRVEIDLLDVGTSRSICVGRNTLPRLKEGTIRLLWRYDLPLVAQSPMGC